MIPWHCDALLPTAERYASLKFRRFARRFDATAVDYWDACELVAFLDFMEGVGHAAWVFHWAGAGKREAQRLVDHLGTRDDVLRMVRENQSAQGRADGLAVLAGMREAGWEKGSVPGIVRLALLDMRDAGINQPAIAAQLGLTVDQVRWMANGARKPRPRLGVRGLIAN